MNAVLVFDPANDLVFTKSNKLFRKRILKYSKLNGLIQNHSSTSTSSCSSTSATTSTSTFSSSACSTGSGTEDSKRRPQRQPASGTSNTCRHSSFQQRQRRRAHRNSPQNQQQPPPPPPAHLDDTNKQYLDILMLLLTPYVASLRLSSNLSAYDRLQRERCSRVAATSAAQRPPKEPTPTGRHHSEQSLLNKFMSSVSINHECQLDEEDLHRFTSQVEPEADTADFAGSQEFAPRRFSTLPMPVECLKDCQIVYCELYDFIFILMQHLEQVSSFKMRLLQKRIDFFARLSLLLFGSSLNSMRISHHHQNHRHYLHNLLPPPPLLVDQSQVLRQTYEVWLEHQFDSQFLLEANERLIISRPTQQLCQETLQRVSRHLRAKSSAAYRYFKETHMHSLLYSNTKLVSSFSCRNSHPLSQDDLILLLLLLKTYNIHHDNEFSQCDLSQEDANETEYLIRTCESPQYCYASNYSTNRHTYEISSTTTTSSGAGGGGCSASQTSGHLSGHSLRRSLKQRLIGSSNEHLLKQLPSKLPDQLLVFLSTGGKFRDRLRTPHMLRLVPLSKGVTMILLAEISTSYLCLQINRVLKILFEFSRCSAQIKLNQLAKINDCVCAIKNYFYGENFEELNSAINDTNYGLDKRSGELLEGSSINSEPVSYHDENSKRRKSVFGNLLNRYLRPHLDEQQQSDEQVNDQRRCRSVYEFLTDQQRRQCCQLICRLEDVVSSNVHTYMLQTFNMSVDEHKREALLSSVRVALRDSIDTFVIKPQMARLNEPMGDYLRAFSEQMDQVRVMARAELNDYLDYLAVKSNCNLTLGAPLTHDMMAIRSFIYVDRRRQELLVSPMRRSATRMDRESMFEGDFCTTVGREHLGDERPNESDDEFDQDDSDGELEGYLKVRRQVDSAGDTEEERRADEADSETTSSESDITAENTSLSSRRSATNYLQRTAAKQQQRHSAHLSGSGRLERQRAGSRWLLSASNDLMSSRNNTATSSAASISAGNSSSTTSTRDLHLATSDLLAQQHQQIGKDELMNTMQQQHQKQANLVDENLMKGFTCFVYNRLANGQTSFSSNDGTYVYSYFLWFKRSKSASVVKLDPERKSQVARKLEANYTSLPSIVCDDFFNRYSRSVYGSGSSDLTGGDSKSGNKTSENNRVEVSCRISQLDPKASGNRRRLIHRKLTLVREEEDGNEDDDENDDGDHYRSARNIRVSKEQVVRPGSRSDRHSFRSFLQSQAAGRSGRGGARSRMKVFQESGEQRPTSSSSQSQPEGELRCFELFCVHQASLLVHRNQVFVEAERLASRLAETVEDSAALR